MREPCVGAPLPPPPAPSEVDYQVFGVRQTSKLAECENKRRLGVEAMDLHNRYVDKLTESLDPPSLWQKVFGRKP